ncbi:hypothetical protein [Roseibium sp.]|uniref:hypothetical protein n=1 Tax=Roseibium sp. TaxID=1936156 RepID=UPI001B020C71|nr:hypothetical protein [Roseibium sp.]MBO6858342.1 hypothetical protein [Roseibium sp.]
MSKAERLEASILEDKRLTWAARGLMVFLIHRPKNLKISVALLVAETGQARKPSGRDAVYGLLRELEQNDYIQRHELREDDGTYGGIEYRIAA